MIYYKPRIPKMFKTLSKLCPPSQLYFVLSTIAVVIMFLQNIGNTNRYCISNFMFPCNTITFIFIFMIKMLFILFWTYILNLICKDGHQALSWFLVLLPVIVAVLVFMVLFV